MIFPDLKDRNVVVTGGANGIGESMVRAFHAQGAQVFFGDMDARAGRALARELGERAEFAVVDLNRERVIASWIGSIGRRHRNIHTLINNAAQDPRIPLDSTTAAQWDGLFATNLRACFLASREAVRWMKPAASIINLASITFHHGPANMTAYVATKGGVIGFTRSLARELGPRRIRVNTISPGWIMTERQLRQFVTPAIKRLIRRSQCIPDLLQPEEIADVALFLASNASRGMTGQELLVDRGWHHS
jgi:NAD(P)-dependent dehydrogenase (short-subunit alcohol dehydrogenase family)